MMVATAQGLARVSVRFAARLRVVCGKFSARLRSVSARKKNVGGRARQKLEPHHRPLAPMGPSYPLRPESEFQGMRLSRVSVLRRVRSGSEAFAARVCSTGRCTSPRVSFSKVSRGPLASKREPAPPVRA